MLCRTGTLFISSLVSCDSHNGGEELMNVDVAPKK